MKADCCRGSFRSRRPRDFGAFWRCPGFGLDISGTLFLAFLKSKQFNLWFVSITKGQNMLSDVSASSFRKS